MKRALGVIQGALAPKPGCAPVEELNRRGSATVADERLDEGRNVEFMSLPDTQEEGVDMHAEGGPFCYGTKKVPVRKGETWDAPQ